MNAKSRKNGTIVTPTLPKEAFEADTADPGEMNQVKAEQRQLGKGKYGSASLKPFKPPEPVEGVETAWIEIEMVDESDGPVAGERYEIEMPDGRVATGTLNSLGWARVEGIEKGATCRIRFPKLDKDCFEFIGSAGPMTEGPPTSQESSGQQPQGHGL